MFSALCKSAARSHLRLQEQPEEETETRMVEHPREGRAPPSGRQVACSRAVGVALPYLSLTLQGRQVRRPSMEENTTEALRPLKRRPFFRR